MGRKITNDEISKSIDDAEEYIESRFREKKFFEHVERNTIMGDLEETIRIADAKSKSIFFRLFGNRGLKNTIRSFQNVLNGLPNEIDRHNDVFAMECLGLFKNMIASVEKRMLDDQQIYSVVYDVRNRLVVAGAGTGKTTTIIGLVKYLVLSGVNPSEILTVSFTNASVDELRNRLRAETGEDIDTFTFHKLALNIISKASGKQPNISHIDLRLFVTETLRKLCENSDYAGKFRFFLRFGEDQNDETEQSSSLKIYSMKGELVKSQGEKDIADYLYLRGIPYVYEESYKADVSDGKHTQYHPDFHLSGTDVYIEYFGTDENGNVAPFVSSDSGNPSEEYVAGIEWKKRCHNEHGTSLISLYYHQRRDGTLFDILRSELDGYGIVSEEQPSENILRELESNKQFSKIANSFVTSVMLLKSCDTSVEKVRKSVKRGDFKSLLYLDVLEPIYETYQKVLGTNGEIDFEDMLNLATETVRQGRFVHNYRYLIVDEYQDISTSRYRLLKALRESKEYHLYCVGDDWQSIYRFNGCDVGYIQDFERFWGPSKICYIERTYRFSGKSLDLSGKFIQKNPLQLRKGLKGPEGLDTFVKAANVSASENEGDAIERKISDLPEGSTVLVLGRYTFDINLIDNAKTRRNSDGTTSLVFGSRKDLDIRFMTVHGSKGLQADYVFIVNCKDDNLGFPNKAKDSPLVSVLLESKDDYPFAEERRLFYVALTRAKKGVYLVLNKGNVSPFVNELFLDV